MSKCTPKSQEFINGCKSAACHVLTAWSNDIRCYYDGDSYAKRDYVLHTNHSWGTAYCDWSDCKDQLFRELREAGATNIIGRVGWNYVDLAFDIKKSKLKELGLL